MHPLRANTSSTLAQCRGQILLQSQQVYTIAKFGLAKMMETGRNRIFLIDCHKIGRALRRTVGQAEQYHNGLTNCVIDTIVYLKLSWKIAKRKNVSCASQPLTKNCLEAAMKIFACK